MEAFLTACRVVWYCAPAAAFPETPVSVKLGHSRSRSRSEAQPAGGERGRGCRAPTGPPPGTHRCRAPAGHPLGTHRCRGPHRCRAPAGHSPLQGRPRHLQEGLQQRHGRVVHQQLERPRRAQRRLRGVPVGQVQAQGLDAGALRGARRGYRGPARGRGGRSGDPGTSLARLSRSPAVRLSAVTRAPARLSATATARPIPAGTRRQPRPPAPPAPPAARPPLPAPVTRARRPRKLLGCGSMLRALCGRARGRAGRGGPSGRGGSAHAGAFWPRAPQQPTGGCRLLDYSVYGPFLT